MFIHVLMCLCVSVGNELNDDPEKVRHNLKADEVLKRWMNMTLGRPTDTGLFQ